MRMEEETNEGDPLLDNQYPGYNNKTFQGIDYSMEERTSCFFSYKRCGCMSAC